MYGNINITVRIILLIVVLITVENKVIGKCPASSDVWQKIIALEENQILSAADKLKKANDLRKQLESCNYPEDSVYARLLHRIAAFKFVLNNYTATYEAIDDILASIRINTSGKKAASRDYVINSYYNLAFFYKTINQNSKSLSFYDSVIIYNRNDEAHELAMISRINKADIFFNNGDYQKCIDEAAYVIADAKTTANQEHKMEAFNRRAQAYAYLGMNEKAFSDADSAQYYAKKLQSDFEMATALKIKARLYISEKKQAKAALCFEQCIQTRIKTKEYIQIAGDYTDFGNYYLKNEQAYGKAEQCYYRTIEYAQKLSNAEFLCRAYINLSELEFRRAHQGDFTKLKQYYSRALGAYGITDTIFCETPSLSVLSKITNIELLLVMLNNKTEWLLNMYRNDGKKETLDACLRSAMVMDSAITMARRQQIGEQSKLYWRNSTRSFFVNAVEACYLANNNSLAFYFMEKSRAVLLNDKINELNAAIHLPETETAKEQGFISRIVACKQRLNELDPDSDKYKEEQMELLKVKSDFEYFITSLEQKYPLYYQYKYVDAIPPMPELQEWLKSSESYFVHYFLQDTVAYILAIGPQETHMVKLENGDFSIHDIADFLSYCSDKKKLNNNYTDFTRLSDKLYQSLFAALHIPEGRVILCQDNFLIPFEAFTTGRDGRDFLVHHYTFSYAYSAGYLLKHSKAIAPASGSFIGFAPVSFGINLQVPDLRNAGHALKNASSYYQDPVLFVNKDASKNNFLKRMSSYAIVNVFSHALADTSSQEPVLYMQDSVINLQELQLINNTATQLVMLSACQTNVGRNAAGEGVYSLARGFASAGIPAVSATLWNADEESIYVITQKMNEYLAGGARKDDALQKAKIYFMQVGGKEKLLPYFWANMILIGNGDPVYIKKANPFTFEIWHWALIILCIGCAVGAYIYRIKF
ncbi:MAG: CHAT domain-containing protein [Chitinophagaceae bacterium]|nr:CHAT domain-containing protein [Chitinophagaceae bacterium]